MVLGFEVHRARISEVPSGMGFSVGSYIVQSNVFLARN